VKNETTMKEEAMNDVDDERRSSRSIVKRWKVTANGSKMRSNAKRQRLVKRAECNEEGEERGRCNGQSPY